jgi:hypothetical protein
MRGLVVAVLIVLAKGIWSTYCRHAFHAPIRPGSKPTVLESDKRRIIGGIAGTVKPLEPEVSDKTNLDNVEPSMER